MFVRATLAATCVFLALMYSITGNDVPVDDTETPAKENKTNRKKKKKYPPGPSGLPFFGVSFQIDPKGLHHNLLRWKQQYGDIISFKLFGKNIVVLNTPELIRKAFESDEFSPFTSDRPLNFIGQHVMYGYKDVLLNRYSNSFKQMKKLMISSINKHGFYSQHFQDLANEEFRSVVKQFHSTDGQPVDPVALLMPSFCKLIGGFFSGKHLEDSDPILKSIVDMDYDGDIMIQSHTHGKLSQLPWLRHCCGFYGNLYRKVIHHRELLYQMLVTDMKKTLDKESIQCFSHELLACQGTGNGNDWLTDEHVNGMLMDLINTSVLTTKSVMSGMVFMWLHLPEVQQKMRAEICHVIGKDRLPTPKDRKDMPYVHACIFELLRYQSHLPLTAAHANLDHDLEFEGYTIPKSSVIFGNLFGAHHDETIWEDPWDFKPERFLTEQGQLVPSEHPVRKNSIAFGVGERKCVGTELAYDRMFLYSAHLLRAFEFLPEDGAVLTPHDPREFTRAEPIIIPGDFKCRVVPL